MRLLNIYESILCDFTGRVFCIAQDSELDLLSFMSGFLNSEVAEQMDKDDYLVGRCGPYYLFDVIQDEVNAPKRSEGTTIYGKATLSWVGYMYRAWNYVTGESSRDIAKICPPTRMLNAWFAGHTMDPELVIEDIKASNL